MSKPPEIFSPKSVAEVRKKRIGFALRGIRARIGKNGGAEQKQGPAKTQSLCTFLIRRSQDALGAVEMRQREAVRSSLEDVAACAVELLIRL